MSGVPGIVWPGIAADADAPLIALVAELERTQWLRAEEIAARQDAQIGRLAEHHARHSPSFAARLKSAGLAPRALASPAGFAALPIARRRDFQIGDALFARHVPPGHGAIRLAATSGSTGEPVTVRRTAVNALDWQAIGVRLHLWHLVAQPARFAALRARLPGVRTLPDWGRPSNLFFASGAMLGASNDIAVADQAKLLAEFAPDVLLAYPSNIEGLIDAAERGGPAFALRQIRTIGETLHARAEARMRAHWGCAVIDCYSSEEAGYIAIRCPDVPGYHVMAEMLRVEILDDADRPCAPGTEGRVVVTDLRNFATPMLRYDLGDRAVAGGPCACGRGLPTIARVAGRERGLILMPDGSRHWPLTGRSGYRGIAPVRQYQMIQTGRETIEVRLVVERALAPAEEEALKAHMLRALGYPFGLHFVYHDDALPRGPTGKLEEFVCAVG